MITFELLSKDELRLMFKGFTTQFMQQPVYRPAKTLRKYIPNGFRPNGLSHPQIVKVYCDAIHDNEPSLVNYVGNEITRTFDETKISDYLSNIKVKNGSELPPHVIPELAAMLWMNGLEIPAHTALLLAGIRCEEATIKASTDLYEHHLEIVEHVREKAYDEGLEKGKSMNASALNSEKKKNERLQKSADDARKQYEEAKRKLTTEGEEKEALVAQITLLEDTEKVLRRKIEHIEKEKTVLENDNRQKKDEIEAYKTSVEALKQSKKENEEKEAEISNLKKALIEAQKKAYSDEILKTICSEVMDEIRSSTLSQKEILELARCKFEKEETIEEGWGVLEKESNEILRSVLNDYSTNIFKAEHIDELEHLEDNELIKIGVIKSLRGILFNSLEREEQTSNVLERFRVNEDGSVE